MNSLIISSTPILATTGFRPVQPFGLYEQTSAAAEMAKWAQVVKAAHIRAE
jgi:hypothetical protein